MNIAIYIALLLILGIWVVRRISFVNRKKETFFKLYEKHFSNDKLESSFESEYIYGYPAFTLIFNSLECYKKSNDNGSILKLKNDLAEICKNEGSKKNPFDIDRALYATYEDK